MLQELVKSWESGSMKRMAALLTKYGTLSSTVVSIHAYLDRARQPLNSLPASDGRTGLLGLTEYLARQTDALGGRA